MTPDPKNDDTVNELAAAVRNGDRAPVAEAMVLLFVMLRAWSIIRSW